MITVEPVFPEARRRTRTRQSLRRRYRRLKGFGALQHSRLPAWLLVTATVFLASIAAAAPENTGAPEGEPVIVTAPYTDMRTGPGRGYPVFHVAEKHETLWLLKRRTRWYKAATADGKVGWVAQTDLDNARTSDGAALDFSVAGWRGYEDNNWEFGLLGGSFSGSESLNVYLGYRMTENLSAELRYAQAFGNFSDSKLATLNVVHRPFPDWRVTPFFTLGAGAIRTSPSATLVETEDREDNLYSVGGGAVFYVSQRFALRLEYNHYTTLTTRDNNEEVEEWKAGFSVSF